MENIIDKIGALAKRLGLEFDKNKFCYIWISKEENVLTAYLSDCHEDIYEKYGSKIQSRMDNVEAFMDSDDYKNLIKREGGQVVLKKSIEYYKDILNHIQYKKAKDIIKVFCKKITKEIGVLSRIVVLTETKNKSEKQHLLTEVLSHELIHILIEENGIRPKNWKYNEGIVTYLDFFMRGRLNKLEHCEKKMHSEFGKEYFRNAIIFRGLLKDVSDSEKMGKIREFIKVHDKKHL